MPGAASAALENESLALQRIGKVIARSGLGFARFGITAPAIPKLARTGPEADAVLAPRFEPRSEYVKLREIVGCGVENGLRNT